MRSWPPAPPPPAAATHTSARLSNRGSFIVASLGGEGTVTRSLPSRSVTGAESHGDQRDNPSPLRKMSIYTEGSLASPVAQWVVVDEFAEETGVPPGHRTRATPTAGLTVRGLRASPLVWSVPDDGPLEGAEPAMAHAPAPSAVFGHSVDDDARPFSETPLDTSFPVLPTAASELNPQRLPAPRARFPSPQTAFSPPAGMGPAAPAAPTEPTAVSRPPLPPSAPSCSQDCSGPQTVTAAAASPVSLIPAPAGLGALMAGPLGPVWTVVRPSGHDDAEDATEATAEEPIASLERLSLEREVVALRQQLDDAQAETEAVRCESQASAEAKVEELLRTRREEERRRRQQFQEALDTLRDENRELTATLEAERRTTAMGLRGSGGAHGRPGAAVAAGDGPLAIPSTLEAEWTRRLDEVEAYWRERLRTAERHWTAEMDAQLDVQKREQQQLRDAQRAAAEMQERVRHVEAESARLAEQVERRLGVPLTALLQQARTGIEWVGDQSTAAEEVPWESVPQLAREVKALRVAAVDHKHREEALLAQLDGYSEEATRLQLALERETQKLKRELDAERRRHAELVELYGGQVQSLHAQLRDAQREKKELVEALRTLQ